MLDYTPWTAMMSFATTCLLSILLATISIAKLLRQSLLCHTSPHKNVVQTREIFSLRKNQSHADTTCIGSAPQLTASVDDPTNSTRR